MSFRCGSGACAAALPRRPRVLRHRRQHQLRRCARRQRADHFDAGTGSIRLARSSRRRSPQLFVITSTGTTCGLPMFRPPTRRETGSRSTGRATAPTGSRHVCPAEQPALFRCRSTRWGKLDFRSIRPGDEVRVGEARVRPLRCITAGCSAIGSAGRPQHRYATDTEQWTASSIPRSSTFARGADLLICDAQYTDDEYRGSSLHGRRGWGNSRERSVPRARAGRSSGSPSSITIRRTRCEIEAMLREGARSFRTSSPRPGHGDRRGGGEAARADWAA